MLIRRFPRWFAALVVVCYAWLSFVTPYEHREHFAPDVEAAINAVSAPSLSRVTLPARVRLEPRAQTPLSTHCLACEWQAANVSPALPPISLALALPQHPRVITTFPRYLRVVAVLTSSRAPPIA